MRGRERIWTGERFYLDAVEVPLRGGGTKKKDMLGHPGAVALVPVMGD
ncbi:MAG: ADP-ribose pyrophosphatase, partial [Actinobacteria bacterium]|nr:ADP-ribose pyrophosphatase [Actinomycetota bacterium]NIU67765.1 ADP-ribose pyrophosphatase [Actinomycetota bacterium]NIW29533.1 ADP-ribose pyrophosphatase [Actinomycetota bacterium]NIX22916.1 ADP-ribose pyrophosphatase [Actinomycetota bacterium]